MKLTSYTWRSAILESYLLPTTRHVLLTLSCHFNDAGEACYPSTKLLSKETGLTERAVITHLAKARELGWLIVSKHGFAGQRWARNQYIPSFPDGTEARSAPFQKGTEAHSAPPQKGTEPNAEKALNDVQSNYSVDLLTTTTTTTAQDCSSGSGEEVDQILHWPGCLPEDSRHLLHGLEDLPGTTQQQILDVVAAAHSAGSIKRTAESLAAGLIRRVSGGKFDPTPGLAIARRRAAVQNDLKKHTDTSTSPPPRSSPDVAEQHVRNMKALLKNSLPQNQNMSGRTDHDQHNRN